MRRSWAILGLLLVFLAACENKDSPDDFATKTPTDTQFGTLSPVYIHLQQDYERLDLAHSTITEIWEGLAAGEQVQCGEYPEVPAPEGISSEGEAAFDELAALIRRAAIETRQAVNLWQAECNNPRATPANDVISEGLLAARIAGDTLEEVLEHFSASS